MEEAVGVPFKSRVALSMTNQGRLARRNRQRRWAPDITVFLVT